MDQHVDTDARLDTGSTPAESALNLRLLLAVFGIAVCAPLALLAFLVGGGLGATLGVVLLLGAAVGVADVVVVQRRRRERAQAERREHGEELHHSLFE